MADHTKANEAAEWRNMAGQSYYEWLCAWYADPANAARKAQLEREYIVAMQRDPRLD